MSSEFFKNNREKLIGKLDDEVVVVTAYDKMQQTKDGFAPFRQESNFWWLTGIDYPSWKYMYDSKRDESFLVRPELSKTEKVFESWLSDDEAVSISGISNVISQNEFLSRQADYGSVGRTALSIMSPKYSDINCHPNPSLANLTEQLESNGLDVQDLSEKLDQLRAIKTPEEIQLIRDAIAVTNQTFESVKSKLGTLNTESEVEAEFSYEFTKQGTRHAYDPIAAFGERACTLHYTNNDGDLGRGLLLLDIGASKDGYNADITRTYALGELTDFESKLHGSVRQAQADIIAMLQPGLEVKEYMQKVDERMRQAIVDLGLMRDMSDDDNYRKYFPHAVSHGLGVDVHDSLGRAKIFKPGMVLTVEPGIYAPEEKAGVRIEDDILITENGHENLSASLSTDA